MAAVTINPLYSNSSIVGSNGSGGMARTGAGMENALMYMDMISNPIICVIGTILNLMSVGTFLSKSLRRISCCLYLATRSLAVFGILLSIIIVWANTFVPLVEAVCAITVFLSYFGPFLASWMVVIISLENLIRIAQPSRVGKFCTPRVAKVVIGTVCLLGVIVYNFPFWTSGINDGQCTVKQDFWQVVLVSNYVDSVLTLVVPLALMIIIVPLVGVSAIHAFERKKRLSTGNGKARTTDSKSSPEARVTHLLLAVSVAFLLLHTPFHVIRIKVFIMMLMGAKMETNSRIDVTLTFVFRLIYNLDTCVSCLVYLIFGDNFRRVFFSMYFSRFMRQGGSTQSRVQIKTGTDGCSATGVSTTVANRSPRLDSKLSRSNDEEEEEDEEKTTTSRLLSRECTDV